MSSSGRRPASKASASSSKSGTAAANGKQKPTSAQPPAPTVNSDETIIQQLQQQISSLDTELHALRGSRNHAQHEVDALQSLVMADEQQLRQVEHESLLIDQNIEQLLQQQATEIQIYEQKILHLEYEQQQAVQLLQSESAQQMQHINKEYELQREKYLQEKQTLLQHLQSNQQRFNDEITSLAIAERKELEKLRENYDAQHTQLKEQYNKQFNDLQVELDLQSRVELHHLQDSKNQHFNTLIQQHQQQYEGVKQYYVNITNDNLQLIQELNTEITQLKGSYETNTQLIQDIEEKNNALETPLKQSQQQVTVLREKLLKYTKNSQSLKFAQKRLHSTQQQLQDETTKYHTLEQQFKQMETERDQLLHGFTSTIDTLKQQNLVKNSELEGELSKLQSEFDLKKSQFTSVLRASNVDAHVLANVTNRLDDLLTSKQHHLTELQYEIQKVNRLQQEAEQVLDAKFKALGLEDEDQENVGDNAKQTIPAAPTSLLVS